MNTKSLIVKYIKGLLRQWYLVVVTLLELLGIILLPFKGIIIPTWVYLIVYGLVFVVANFLVYRDTQIEANKLQEEHQKEIAELQNRIADIEANHPHLDLFFKNGERLEKDITILVGEPPEKPDIDGLVQKEKQSLSNLYEPSEKKSMDEEITSSKIEQSVQDALRSFSMMETRKEPKEYQKECDSYLLEYRSYLNSKYYFESGKARKRSVSFVIKNGGKVPAKDIILETHFQDVFRFPENDKWEKMIELFGKPPKAPKPPKPTKSVSDLMDGLRVRSFPPPFSANFKIPDVAPRNVSPPHITKKNSTEVSYEIKELMHNFDEYLDSVDFFITNEAIDHSWNIEYQIHAANLPNPIRGTLSIQVRKEQ